MNTDTYRFNVGKFDCLAVSDGTFAYPHPGQVFFPNAPQDRLAEALQPYDIELATWTEYVSPYPSLVVNTGQNLVLVDTGAGDFAPTTGNLIANLRSVGVAPEAIDTVILTHGHVDHIGGNVDKEGRPAFPNARYVMWQQEWEFWTSEPDLSAFKIAELRPVLLNFARRCLPPIEDRVDLVDSEKEIVPGIHALAGPGHTPGHMALSITSQDEHLIEFADTVLHPIHVEQPDWVSAVDLLPEETVITRRKLLGRAAVEQALVRMYHFPFPGLGYVVLEGDGWRWRPLEVTAPAR